MALDLTDLGYPAVDATKEAFVELPEIEEPVTAPEPAPTPVGLDLTDLGYIPEELEMPGLEAPEVREAPPVEEIGPLDIARGTVETIAGVVGGAALWPFAQSARHGAVLGQIGQQWLGLAPHMTPEEISVMGEETAEYVQSLHGLLTPRSASGKASLDLVGKVFEPISRASHWLARGIDPERHPNLHNLVATGAEVMAFATIPKAVKGVKAIAEPTLSKAVKRIEKKRARVGEEAIPEADMQSVLDKAEKLVDTPEKVEKLKDRVSDWQEKVISGEKTLEGRRAEQAAAVEQQRALKAQLEAAKIERPAVEIPEEAVKILEIPPREPVRPPIEFKTAQELQAERFGKTAPAGRELLDKILEPLKNERGEVVIKSERSKARLGESERESIRHISDAAFEAKQEVKDFLISRGMNEKEALQVEKLHKIFKEENPIKSAPEVVKSVKDEFKPFELEEGDVQVNTGEKANLNIKVGTSDANAIFSSPRGGKGIKSYFQPAEFMFDKYPQMKPLLHKAREIEATIVREKKIQTKHLKDIVKQFPSKKLRNEAGATWHALDKQGADAMRQMNIKISERPQYIELKTKIQPLFKDLFDRVNEQRIKLGKRPIPERADYLTFYAKESLYNDFKNLFSGKHAETTNLIMDDLATINQRQTIPIKDSVAFHHLRRRGLEKGVELDLDPISIYSRYLDESLRHIHMSPLNAFVKELLSSKLTDVKTGKAARFKDVNPSAAAELASWNNKLAGLSNLPLPRTFERLIQRGMNNLTVAQLFGNARTAAVQTVALFPTAVKHGYIATGKGIADTVVRRKNAPIEKSAVLESAVMDAAVADMANVIAGTRGQRIISGVKAISVAPMQWLDYLSREATFRTAWNSLEPLVKKGKMRESEAIRLADSEVIRTQASGAPPELSPIQRNAIGKMATLWQTFTINHINFIAKDVLGIKDPVANPRRTAARVARYVGGMLAINALFEQVGGVQSPLPAPVQTIIRSLEEGDTNAARTIKTLLEVSEVFPFGSSIKFGGSPVGPLIDHASDITEALAGSAAYNPDMLERAIGGDQKALLALGEILGKTFGVPFTAQVAKATRGLARGETLGRAIAGRIGKPRKKVKKRRRKRRRRVRR